MTVVPHQPRRVAETGPSMSDAYPLGVPGVNGRWQPTLAGVVKVMGCRLPQHPVWRQR